MKLFLVVLLTLPLLLGCSSSAIKTKYYQLPHTEQMNSSLESAGERQLLQLKALKLAPFLNQQGIAFQHSATELSLASQHLWADSLSSQLQRHLRQHIHSHSPRWHLVLQGHVAEVQLTIQLDRFVGTSDGYALVSGEYHLQSATKQLTEPFFIRQSLQQDGYPALIEALALGWQELAAELLLQLEKFD